MNILSIDPGLDCTGVAIWRSELYEDARSAFRPDMAAALRALVGTLTVTTAPADPLDARLAEIAREVRELVGRFGAGLVWVETPAHHGDYGDDPGRRNGANALYMALGAILSGLGQCRGHCRIVQLRAGRSRKEERRTILEQNARVAGIRLPQGPRGGKRLDEIDAIWIGAYGLSERLSRDLAAPAA